MATPEDQINPELKRLRDIKRLRDMEAQHKQRVDPDQTPAEVPALQQTPQAEQPTQEPPNTSWMGKSGPELSPLERMRKIKYLDDAQGALSRGEDLPEPGEIVTPDTGKSAWGDAKTTAKIAALYPVAGYLGRGERELQLRSLTKDLVAERMDAGDIAAIESVAGMKVADMRWQDFDRAAERHYGTEKKEGQWLGRSKWRNLLRGLMGYTSDDEKTPAAEPAFPMAEALISGSLNTGNVNFYENVIRQKFSNDTPELAETMIAAVQEVSKGYQQETKESLEKTMVAEDAIWYNPLTYFNEDTKDPYHDLSAFMHTMFQQSGNLAGMIIAARTGGRVGAHSYTKSLARPGLATADIQAMQMTGARWGGALAGGKAEMNLIRDGVFTEANEQIQNNVAQDVWDNHDPYLRLVEGGLTPEEAKQIIAYSHANNAGDMAMMLSGALMGTPMGAFYGSMTGVSAGREMAKQSILRQMGKGAALETGQEMAQELTEQISSNLAMSKVDPDQDLFEGGLEAVTTAFFISAVPGALGGIHDEKGAGIARDHDALIRKAQPWVNAMNERWKHQNKVGPNTVFDKDASPQDQLKAMLELERLQKKEAEEFMKIKDDAQSLMDKMEVDGDKQLEFKAQVAGYESMAANIAKQQTRRAESRKALREEKRVLAERADAQKSIERDVQSMGDAHSLVDQLETIQKGEALAIDQYEEMAKAGYGKYSGRNNEVFVLTPRGVRAIPELNAMIAQTSRKLESGYTGAERRGDPARREEMENMSSEEFDKLVYTDADTQLRNKRAWNEESEGYKAVAVMDADSLKWVNDNMSHSAGTEYLQKIANEIKAVEGNAVSYRYGGDEFIVAGQDMEELQETVESAIARIKQAARVEEGGQSVQPSVTVGYGADFNEADRFMKDEKAAKTERGERAGREEAPPSFKTVVDADSPQMTLFAHYTEPTTGGSLVAELREAVATLKEAKAELTAKGRMMPVLEVALGNAERKLREALKPPAPTDNIGIANKLTEDIATLKQTEAELEEKGVSGTLVNLAVGSALGNAEQQLKDVQKLIKDVVGVQQSLFHYQDDMFEPPSPHSSEDSVDGEWEEYERTINIQNKARALHVRPPSQQHMQWIEDIAEEFLPATNNHNPPVNIVEDPSHLHDVSPRQYDELLEMGFNVWGVRGLFSLDDPAHGVFLIASNIVQQASTGLRKGQRISNWRSARLSTREGDQVEVIAPDGTWKLAVIEKIKSDHTYQLPKKSMSQRRVENKLKNKTRELNNWRKHVRKLEDRAENLSDEEFNNFDNPLIIKLDDATEKLYDLQIATQQLKIADNEGRAFRLTSYKPVDTSDDRITVKMEDGTKLTFDPNKNQVVDGATQKANPFDGHKHNTDNQGLCHTCGLPMNDDYGIAYFGENEWNDVKQEFKDAHGTQANPKQGSVYTHELKGVRGSFPVTEAVKDGKLKVGSEVAFSVDGDTRKGVVTQVMTKDVERPAGEASPSGSFMPHVEVETENGGKVWFTRHGHMPFYAPDGGYNTKKYRDMLANVEGGERAYLDKVAEETGLKTEKATRADALRRLWEEDSLGKDPDILNIHDEQLKKQWLGKDALQGTGRARKTARVKLQSVNVGIEDMKPDLKIGRIRAKRAYNPTGPEKQFAFSGYWKDNLGNEAAATDEKLTKDHLREMVADTLMHETVGHYGIRGITRDYKTYERLTHAIVDAFPAEVAELRRRQYVYRDEFSASQNKALLGEEILAWRIGELFGSMKEMTPIQRTAIQRFMLWFKEQLLRLGYGKVYYGVKGARVRRLEARINQLKKPTWKDRDHDLIKTLETRLEKMKSRGVLSNEDLKTVIARSHDYIRNGGQKWKFSGEDGKLHFLPMRDAEIFLPPVTHVVQGATRELDEGETMPTVEDYGTAPPSISMAEAYHQVTGAEMPTGWAPLTPAAFKDESKRLEAEMTAGKSPEEIKQMRKDRLIPNPKQLYDRATANMSEEQKAVAGRVQKAIAASKEAATQHQERSRKLDYRKEVNARLRKQFGDDAIDQGKIPIFPESATVQGYIEAVNEAVDRGHLTKMEVEASGVLEKLWPSRVNKLLVMAGGSSADLSKMTYKQYDTITAGDVTIPNTEKGISEKRIEELMKPQTRMTAEEAQIMADLVAWETPAIGVVENRDNRVLSSIPIQWAHAEEWEANNGLIIDDVAGMDVFTAGQTDWIINLLGEDNEITESYMAMKALYEAEGTTNEGKIAAHEGMSSIGNVGLPPTSVNLPKAFLLELIAVPNYEIIAGDPRAPKRSRARIYKELTGEEISEDYDQYDEANQEMEAKIVVEQEKDARYGPNIGLNERTGEWYDPLSDYSGQSGAWQGLVVPGMIPDTYRAAVFFQVPQGGAKGSSSHFPFANIQGGRGHGTRGSVGHTRYGMAWDADENAPTADNPENQGKAGFFVESQSDNEQRATKRYPSQEAKKLADELHITDEAALTASYRHMQEGIANGFIDLLEEKAAAILPDVEEQEAYLLPLLTPEMRERMDDADVQMFIDKYRLNVMLNTNMTLFADSINAVREKYRANNDLYPQMIDINSMGDSQTGPFGNDARAFQILDDVAKFLMLEQMRHSIQNGFTNEMRVLSEASMDTATWTSIKAAGGMMASLRSASDTNKTGLTIGDEYRSSLNALISRGTYSEKNSYGYRFNWMGDQPKKLMTELFEQLTPNGTIAGVSAQDRANKIWEDMQSVSSAKVSFKYENMSDILGMDSYDTYEMLTGFPNYMTRIAGPSVNIKVTEQEDWKVTFSVVGKAEQVKAFESDFRDHVIAFINSKHIEQQRSTYQREVNDQQHNLESARNTARAVRMDGEGVRAEHQIEQVTARAGANLAGLQISKTYKSIDGLSDEDALALLSAHEAMTFEEYVEAAWRRGYPRMDNNEQLDPNNPPDWKVREYREKFNDHKPFVITGTIPVKWDADGVPTDTVQMNIVRLRPGETQNPVMRINGEPFNTFASTYYVNREYGKVVARYYEQNNIVAPSTSKFGENPDIARYEALLADAEAQLAAVDDEMSDTAEDSATDVPAKFDNYNETYGDLSKAFDNEIAYHKKKGVQEANLIGRNDQWRLNHIQHQFSDLVRRGIPRMFFFPGTASGARGAFISGTDSEGLNRVKLEMVVTEKIKWSLHRKEIRGQQRDIVVVDSDDIHMPLWIDVSGDNLVSFNPDRKISDADELTGYFSAEIAAKLGRYVAENIAMKIKESKIVGNKVDDSDKLLVSHTPDDLWVVHNRAGVIIGTGNTPEEARNIRTNHEAEPSAETVTEENALSIGGIVTEGELGVPIHILKTRYHGGGVPYPLQSLDYQHTISPSTMEGGRRNYDITFMRNLREYAARYDMKIEEGKMKVPSQQMELAVRAHGLPRVVQLEESVANTFTNIAIEEITGENFGFIINSDAGLVVPNVFPTQQAAGEGLRAWIDRNTVPDSNVVKVYQITISDKAKAAHKKGVSPFIAAAYKMNPDLKSASEKIGSDEPRLVDRFNAWRQSWKAGANVGIFDKLYGIDRAVKHQGLGGLDAADDPYIQSRMTTGLESMMRGIMEYGHPVRREGVIENEGRGLLEILSPIAGDVELWAMYMAGVRAKRLLAEDKEKLFTADEIDAMVNLGEEFPMFKQVAKDYAEFNSKMLDFAESSGVVNAETRPLWENADYIPFYRIADQRLVGPLAKGVGIANQNSPIKTLKGGEENLGDLVHNIFTNLTNLMDASVKNHAALLAIDLLEPTGVIRKQAYAFTKELIPMGQVGKILQQNGIDIKTMPDEVTQGLQTMFAINQPEGPGIVSVLRNGKKEYYFTEDELLFRSLSAINIKAFGAWMNLLRGPKRLLTSWITLDPGFMLANFVRDSMSAFVLSRDTFIPLASGLKGFHKAITEGETMRTMIGAGAAFESGYINQGDPKAAQRQVKRSMKDAGFQRTVLDTPRKLFNGWKRIGSATENANRIAVYEAAIRAGKSKAQALFESKDIMDFSMGGDWPVIQFLIQTVPFLGARAQGEHRLVRGAMERPAAFAMKGGLLTIAGMALWFAFRDDERYKELEDWDKDTYFHWWIGDNHYRLPKGFEIGAMFNTVPERIFEYMYSKENDAGQLLMRRWGFMMAETFNMNPIPQTFRPMAESFMNENFFRGSSIETPYEEDRLPPERYRYYTSPTMVELSRLLPDELDTVSGKIRSPLHLQNLYAGYTGTLGRYIVMASDATVRFFGDYAESPDWTIADYPVVGRFVRGDAPRRTKYEEEFYNMLRTTLQVKESLRFLDQKELDSRFDKIEEAYAPYVEVAPDLERYRKEISGLNKEIREINEDKKLKTKGTDQVAPDQGAEKRRQINDIQEEKNVIFKEAWELRPGAQDKNTKTSQESVKFLIDNFNVDAVDANDELNQKSPTTASLVGEVSTMPKNQLERLAKNAVE